MNAGANPPRVVAIFGPTGSGKTDVAVHVARALETDVVNADPAQCYAGLPILTNQPTTEHDAIAPHHLIGCWSLRDVASIVTFAHAAHACIDELITTRGVAVVCGGSGLYLQAALTHLARRDLPDRGAELRAELDERYAMHGAEHAHAQLARLDPVAAARIHRNDRKRLIRAWQVALTGATVAPRDSSVWQQPQRHATRIMGLGVDRAVIRDRIGRRTREMFDAGVVEEVAGVVGPRGEHADEALSVTARRLHGLDDCIGVLRGQHTREQAIELMTTRTRQYAKRQDTWARRVVGLQRVETLASGEAADAYGADVLARRIVDLVRSPLR